MRCLPPSSYVRPVPAHPPGALRSARHFREPAQGASTLSTEEPIMAGVAGRYASALFELATEQRQVAEVEASLGKFQAGLDASPELRRLVRSPVFSADEQSRALKAL